MNMSKGKKGRKSLSCLAGILIIVVLSILLFSPISVKNQNEEIEVGTELKLNPTITYLGMDISKYVEIIENVDTSIVGEYDITYKCGMKSVTKTIKVVDKIAPVIELQGEKILYTDDTDYIEGVEQGVIVTDNYDKDIKATRRIKRISDTEYEFYYTAIDSSGNTSIATREVIIAKGVICLTFDDGPSGITPSILDVLKENDVKATFFIVDYPTQYEDTVSRIINEGHTLGIHGMSHNYSKIYSSPEAIMENFTTLQNKIMDDFNYLAKYIRFPGGSSNTISKNYCEGVMKKATNMVKQEKMEYYDWNVDTDDAGSARTPDEIYNNFVNGIQPGLENVVLMHDGEGHEPTLKALQKIISYAKENGYVFTAISEQTTPVQHSVNN